MTATRDEALELRRMNRFWTGLRAVGLGLVSNLGLIVLKATVGIVGNSQGLVADAIHSAADLVNSISAVISLAVSRRPADISHPYGHGRAEALGATFASFVIGAAGLLTGWEAILELRSGRHDGPSLLTLWVALFALVIKLLLAFYSNMIAKRVQSKAVSADARDHLADAMASAFVIAGILGARLGYPALDSLGALIVAGFILYTAYEVFFDAAVELMDTSLPEEERQKLVKSIEEVTDRDAYRVWRAGDWRTSPFWRSTSIWTRR